MCNCDPNLKSVEIRCIVPNFPGMMGGIFKVRINCRNCHTVTRWAWEKEN